MITALKIIVIVAVLVLFLLVLVGALLEAARIGERDEVDER